MTEYSYVVTHLTGGTTVISSYVEDLEVVNTGSGEVKSAKLTLSALSGKFLTVAPILAQFDRIQITITDSASTVYYQVYEVDRIIPIKNAGEGYRVEVELLSQEHHLQKVDMAKQYYFVSGATVTKSICGLFNNVAGTSQPIISGHGTFSSGNNELPQWTSNNYEFGVSEIKVYDALMDVVEGLGATVAAGGAGDFFELWFDSHESDKLKFKAFRSGGIATGDFDGHPNAGSEITITDSTSINLSPLEGGIDSITGTLIKAWGNKNAGTLPNSVQNFAGELEAFILTPDYVSGIQYPVSSRVNVSGTVYQANTLTSSTPTLSNPDWTSKTFASIHGADGYSLWTDGALDAWESCLANPSGDRQAFDSNLIIEDGIFHQDFALHRVYTDAIGTTPPGKIPSSSLYSGTDLYRGFRVLVDPSLDTLAGSFAQNLNNDRFGKPYSGNIVQHNGGTETVNTYKNWDVVRVTADSERCAVRYEAKMYRKTAGAWAAYTDNEANHCFHPVTSITYKDGYNKTLDDGVGGTTYGTDSAVEWLYEWTGVFSVLGIFDGADYYKAGAWASFSLPFPENGVTGGTIGSFYGSASKLEPATLDANNMHLTHSGKTGFNNDEAEDLGILDGIQCQMKFKWEYYTPLEYVQQNRGNFKFRCALYDTSGNVVTQDFVIPFNGLWQQVKLPFAGFTNYRARIPRSTGEWATLVTKDLEILNVFHWKNIKLISFQFQDSYDDEGRYHPDVHFPHILPQKMYLTIDAFCFTKPLLAVTAPITDRCIEPSTLNFPDVSNAKQLSQIVNSQLDIEKYQHKEYTINTQGKLDIKFGDTFFLKDSVLINDSDTRTADSGGIANTIRLVAKRITYKIDKKNGFMRTILGIKRVL